MMLRWRELHPYNPVHVVRVPVALDEPSGCARCIAERLRVAGPDRPGGGPGPLALPLRRRAGRGGTQRAGAAGDDAQRLLSRTIEREFNRPFVPAAREQPFRFIAIDEGAAFQLLLVYDHYVASGDSIARLLTRLACALAPAGRRCPRRWPTGLPPGQLPPHPAAPPRLGAARAARPAAHGGRCAARLARALQPHRGRQQCLPAACRSMRRAPPRCARRPRPGA